MNFSFHTKRLQTHVLNESRLFNTVEWLVGCFGFNSYLRQYFILHLAVSLSGREKREMIEESKNVQTTPTRTSAVGPWPIIFQISKMPRHWMFTQHHPTTRPPPLQYSSPNM